MPSPDVQALRTPDSRFADLPGFPYEPKYLQYGNLRMAYIDEHKGKQDGQTETFLCLHGQPTWSYLYRRMIPVFLDYTTSGSEPSRRVIAPDLLGFGRSDKPARDETYTYNFHRDSLLHLIRTLDLSNVTLVVQDWGGLLGLTLPIAELSRFKRLIVMNTSLATGQSAGKGFDDWRDYNNRSPDLNIGDLIGRGTKHLSAAEKAAYNAPYPNQDYKGGVRRFPNLVMTDPNMEGVDISKQSLEMYKTSDHFKANDIFMAIGMKDPVLGPPVMRNMAKMWKNGCFWTEVAEGGHFVQEWGADVAKKAIEAFEKQAAPEGVTRVDPQSSKL